MPCSASVPAPPTRCWMGKKEYRIVLAIMLLILLLQILGYCEVEVPISPPE
jgi:hypothetical protein